MTPIVSRARRLAPWGAALGLLLAASPAPAQRARDHGRNTSDVTAAFRPVVAGASESTVRVLCDGAETALGTVVAADGYIVTKYSELKGKIVCRLKGGKELPARVVGAEDRYDLAMLKVDAADLRPVEWRAAGADVGDWVATAATSSAPAAVGVVSVAARRPDRRESGPAAPPPNSGFLGIALDNADESGAVIARVEPKSAAEKAGLKAGDIVLTVGGKRTGNAERLILTIQRYRVGEKVTLKVRRGEDEKELTATLGRRPRDMFSRGDRMNAMGSELSRKRTGFPAILQHDTVLRPKDCGGPLVDLDGKAVGVNVARAGRTESYAIPAAEVLALLPDLKSGKLAPKDDEKDPTKKGQK